MYKNVQKCTKMYKNVQTCKEMYKNAEMRGNTNEVQPVFYFFVNNLYIFVHFPPPEHFCVFLYIFVHICIFPYICVPFVYFGTLFPLWIFSRYREYHVVIYKNVQKCTNMYKNVQKCTNMNKNEQKCTKMYKNVQKCTKM